LFIYSPGKDSLPPIFSAHPLSHVSLLLIAYYSVSLFFPGLRSVCPGGYAALAQACLWEYRKLTWSVPSKPSGRQRLAAQGPFWFLLLTWSGDSLRQPFLLLTHPGVLTMVP
jgi:hypothetical protein